MREICKNYNKSNMKMKNMNSTERAERYTSPEISVDDIVSEYFLCISGDNDDDGDGDAELPQPGGWL